MPNNYRQYSLDKLTKTNFPKSTKFKTLSNIFRRIIYRADDILASEQELLKAKQWCSWVNKKALEFAFSGITSWQFWTKNKFYLACEILARPRTLNDFFISRNMALGVQSIRWRLLNYSITRFNLQLINPWWNLLIVRYIIHSTRPRLLFITRDFIEQLSLCSVFVFSSFYRYHERGSSAWSSFLATRRRDASKNVEIDRSETPPHSCLCPQTIIVRSYRAVLPLWFPKIIHLR